MICCTRPPDLRTFRSPLCCQHRDLYMLSYILNETWPPSPSLYDLSPFSSQQLFPFQGPEISGVPYAVFARRIMREAQLTKLRAQSAVLMRLEPTPFFLGKPSTAKFSSVSSFVFLLLPSIDCGFTTQRLNTDLPFPLASPPSSAFQRFFTSPLCLGISTR